MASRALNNGCAPTQSNMEPRFHRATGADATAQRFSPSTTVSQWLTTLEDDESLRHLRSKWTRAAVVENRARSRKLHASGGDNIHHFNWLGDAVTAPSNTPPETSLFVIMSPPKVPSLSSRQHHIDALMANAMKWVDPVVVAFKNGADFPRSPQQLMETYRNNTFRLYTEHGTWKEEDSTDTAIVDACDAETYDSETLGIGNGYIDNTPIKSSRAWKNNVRFMQKFAQKAAKNEGRRWLRGEKPFVKRSSPLKNGVSMSDVEHEEVMDNLCDLFDSLFVDDCC